jgi:hypothetical protein
MARRDDTPLPPPRPPTIDVSPYVKALARKKRRWIGWALVIALGAVAWGAVARLRYVDAKSQRTIEATRNEAAEHRSARFAAEAEVARLREENARLAKALAEAAAAIAKANLPPAAEPVKKPEATP